MARAQQQQITRQEIRRRLITGLRHGLDPVVWAKEKLGIELDDWQVDIAKDFSGRISILAPRQSGKSLLVSVMLAHKAAHLAKQTILILAASARQSVLLLSKVTDHLATADIKFDAKSESRIKLPNGSQVIALPSSAALVRGFSADVIALDEFGFLPKGDDASIISAVSPMLATRKNGKMLMISSAGPTGTLFHSIMTEPERNPGWSRYEITLDQCPRLTPEFLAEERARIGDILYSFEFLCVFSDSGMSLIDSMKLKESISKEKDDLLDLDALWQEDDELEGLA